MRLKKAINNLPRGQKTPRRSRRTIRVRRCVPEFVFGVVARIHIFWGNRMAHMVFCAKYNAQMEGLDEMPFDSDFGKKVYDNVSKKAWGEWVEHQKMLLNEYRLQPWTREAQEFLVEQMQQFFFGAGAALPKEFVPPTQ